MRSRGFWVPRPAQCICMSSSHFDDLNAHYLDQPHEVALETMALCNAACTFCPYPTLERKGARMSDSMITSLLNQMAEFERPFYFSPFKVNEPLLDKRLEDIVWGAIRTTKALVRIFTNGSPLTKKNEDWIAELPQGRVAHLWVSLNSVDPDEHKALMGTDFAKVAKNLDRLHQNYRFPHPVMLSAVGVNRREFLSYCRGRWPRFQSTLIPDTGWLGYSDPDREEVPTAPCARWWELSIQADGVVSLCCMDGTGAYAIGNVKEQTLLEVYNSPTWRERRETLQNRHEIDPCNRCTY